MSIRELMIQTIIDNIRDPNNCSRYGLYFYTVKVEDTKRERKFNERSRVDGKYNLADIEDLDDEELFDAYNKFMRRHNTWM